MYLVLFDRKQSPWKLLQETSFMMNKSGGNMYQIMKITKMVISSDYFTWLAVNMELL